ncbi:MAG: sigma-70 family RNA polymerase sigma factor, partial [Terriglobia bacterium]|nr:sigma-70 family RNA polymerase sigma factor [Terriglobia bacterium]
ESIGALAAYLWRTAINLWIDRGRRRTLDQRFRRGLAMEKRSEFSTDILVESKERLVIVERAIAELPPRCLEAFILHVCRCMTFAEVGHEMGISDRMAKKHVARALQYLQSALDAADAPTITLPNTTA